MTVDKSQIVTVPLRSDGFTQDEFCKLKYLIKRDRTQGGAAFTKKFFSELTVVFLATFGVICLFDSDKLFSSQTDTLLKTSVLTAIAAASSAVIQERNKQQITRQFREHIDVGGRKGLTEILIDRRDQRLP